MIHQRLVFVDMPFDETTHRRKPLRLSEYDYTQTGAYFVTICTVGRQCLLHDTPLMSILADVWMHLPNHYPTIALDAFVIMPNHIHFIVWLNQDGMVANVGAGLAPVPKPMSAANDVTPSVLGQGQALPLQTRAWAIPKCVRPNMHPRLGDVVGGYKSLVFKTYFDWINRNHICGLKAKFWQRNYYEHIIRDETALNAIRRYIQNNPAKWEIDRDNLDGSHPSPQAQSINDYLIEMNEYP